MVDSVHTARWLKQLRGQGFDVHLFPSTRSRVPHPDISEVTVYGYGRPPADLRGRVRWCSLSPLGGHLGRLGARLIGDPAPDAALRRVLLQLNPDVVHSMEIQAAGYLTVGLKNSLPAFPPWLVSVWGSDLVLFGQLAAHRERVREVVGACDALHVECDRDLRLGRDMGLKGRETPRFPASAGFDIPHLESLRSPIPPSQRKDIVIKGYQGWAGRSLFALRAVELASPFLRDYRIRVYLAPPEVAIAAELLAGRTGLRIEMVSAGRPHDQMLAMHSRARVSIGLSVSDGISASLLEAMLMGSFPIQSDTGCGCEWVRDGETGFLVPPESPEETADRLRRAITDDALVDRAAALNWETCRSRLDARVIVPRVAEMYRDVAAIRPAR